MAGRSTSQRRITVALDGPASSGKSSVGSAAAEQLGLRFVDTGLLYRAVTALALREGVSVDDAAALVALVARVALGDDGTGRLNRVLLDGQDATDDARSGTVDSFVSAVARVPEVREALLERQRTLAAEGGIVLAGRDIGTVVLPDADLKLYLDASVEERAQRRIEERGLDPDGEEAEEVRERLRVRDAIDTGREVAPLRAADDAVRIHTDGNRFDDTVEIVAAEIARVMLTPRRRTRAKPPATRSRTAAAAAAAASALGVPETPETAAAAEAEVDFGPFDVGATAAEADGSPFHVAYPAAEAAPEPPSEAELPPDVDPGPEPEPAPEVDPGPFALTVTAASTGANPFHVAYPAPEPEPATPESGAPVPAVEVDPGPFSVGMVAPGSPGNPFRVEHPEPEPEPAPAPPAPVVDPGPFAVTVPAAATGADPFHVAYPGPEPEPEQASATMIAGAVPPTDEVDPGPFEVGIAASASPGNPFRVEHPEPEPQPGPDRGPFSVAAPSADAGADPFRVAYPFADPEPEGTGEPEGTEESEGTGELEASVPPDPAIEPATTVEPGTTVEPQPPLEAPPLAAAVPAAATAPRPVSVAPRRRETVLEAAMRLDNHQTTMIRYVGLVARVGARLFADVRIEGLDRIPRKGAVILASNHISNADPVVVGAWISEALKRRRIHWLGKRELFDWPVLGWMAAHGGIHPVDRDGADVEAFRLATRILEKGYVLLVFPEGTRSPTGELQEAKDGVGMLALRTGAQVVPIGVNNTDAVWRKGRPLPLPFPRRTVRVRIGQPFRVQDVIPEGTDRRAAKGLATAAIMGRIAELLDPRHRGVYATAIREDAAAEE